MEDTKETKPEGKKEEKQMKKEPKQETETEKKPAEGKSIEEKKKAKLPGKIVRPREVKHEAVVRGTNLPISTKHAIAICNFIKNKTIEGAILDLEQVIKLKKAIPFRGEIPHRHDRGVVSGRYPIKAAKEFIKLLKNLNANAVINGLDLDKAKINARADIASRKRFSRKYRKFKRSNILLIVREIGKSKDKKNQEK